MSLRRSRFPAAAVAVVGIIAFLNLSCGGGSSPSTPTPSATVPPAPTPTPPTGGGGVGASSCSLGNGDVNAECDMGSSRLIDAVITALDTLVQTKPQIFDKTQEAGAGTGQYLVVDKEAYLDGIVSNLIAAGFCAQRDPDDPNYERIQVKNENGFSETYDVLTSTGYMRRNGNIYRETCTPASFPVSRGDAPPAGSGCGRPYPEPISRMNCKLHLYGQEYYTLDSTAIVGPDVAYCAAIGYTDGRSLCPVRKEDNPERGPCEEWRVGYAKDTGRTGPTWTSNGKYCTGKESGCENHPANQYALLVYTSGTFTVCAQTGDCCKVIVER
jgi:hypothetical protein